MTKEISEDKRMDMTWKVFYSYSHKDEELRNGLEIHLRILQKKGIISEWHDRRIGAGMEWEDQLDSHLDKADLILLLISPDFLASDYCIGEMERAMQRHQSGQALVIPIILRTADWKETVLENLQALPKDGRPVVKWRDRDEAFFSIAEGIKAVASARSYRNAKADEKADAVTMSAGKDSGVEVVPWASIQRSREEERLEQSWDRCKKDTVVKFISITGKSFLIPGVTYSKRDHFEEAIKRGVKFQGILLDPVSAEAVFRSEIESPGKALKNRLLMKDASDVSKKLKYAPPAWVDNLRIGYSQIGLAFKVWLFEDEAYIEPYHFGKKNEEERSKDESPMCGFSHIWLKPSTMEYEILKDHFDKLWSNCKRYWPKTPELSDSDSDHKGPKVNSIIE